MVMCTLVGPRCMWCCMGAVGCAGVCGGCGVFVFVVLVGGRNRANWCSKAAPSCRAVGMSRERV